MTGKTYRIKPVRYMQTDIWAGEFAFMRFFV